MRDKSLHPGPPISTETHFVKHTIAFMCVNVGFVVGCVYVVIESVGCDLLSSFFLFQGPLHCFRRRLALI